MIKRIIFAFIVLILASNTCALDAETYDITFNIIGDKAEVNAEIGVMENSSGTFEFRLPEDYLEINLFIDNSQVMPVIEDSMLTADIVGNKKISLSYTSKDFIDKSNFLVSMDFNLNISRLEIKAILPEGATLMNPIRKASTKPGSIYPKPDTASTDGKRLIFTWQREDVEKGDDMSIFIQMQKEKNYMITIASLVILIIAGIGFIYFKGLNTKRQKAVDQAKYEKKDFEKTDSEIDLNNKEENSYKSHLKEDEEQIINILKRKEGNCEQATLRVITGFSKATLSRLLMELEARKFIHKEKKGKKNLIFLK